MFCFKKMKLTLAFIAFFSAAGAQSQTITFGPNTGFDMNITLIASGLDSCPKGNDRCDVVNDTVVDSNGIPMTGDYFQRHIMKRDDVELEKHRLAAVDFFTSRFGQEVISGIEEVNTENEAWHWIEQNIQPWSIDPRVGYRAVSISQRVVPKDGYIVRDGGWLFAVNGRGALYGEYNILLQKNPKNAFVSTKSDMILHYQSSRLLDGLVNPRAFACELWYGDYDNENPKLRGLSQGIVTDGLDAPNIRTVMTLNKPGKADYPGLGTNDQ